jgi:hypothetical protein
MIILLNSIYFLFFIDSIDWEVAILDSVNPSIFRENITVRREGIRTTHWISDWIVRYFIPTWWPKEAD